MLFVGGGFGRSVNKRRLMKVVGKIAALGIADVALVTMASKYSVEKWLQARDRSAFDVFHTGVRMGMYLKEMSRYHCFVSFSDNDSMVDEIEDELLRLIMGQVGVFPCVKWVTDRIGEDYPFLYNVGKEEEAIALLEWIVDNFGDAQERISSVVEKLAEEHDDRVTLLGAWSEIVKVIDSQYAVNIMRCNSGDDKKSLFSLVYDVATKLGDKFAIDVFLDVLEEHATWLKPWGRKGTLKQFGDVDFHLPTLFDLREMLDNLGWVDQCDGADIMLKRERSPLEGVFVGK